MPRTAFLCTHEPNDERPPQEIPIYLKGRGNGADAFVDQAAAGQADAGRRLQAADPRESADDWAEARADLSAATGALNHHQIECSVCAYNERINGVDIERLLTWAEREGLSHLPLRSVRRVLALIPE